MDWSQPQAGQRAWSPAQFAGTQAFVLQQWRRWAVLRQAAAPQDLSGACRYGSLFMCRLYGGAIRGHYQHQYNDLQGRHVDLSRDAADVQAMRDPWQHEPLYFQVPELQRALQTCLPRVDDWVAQFLSENPQSAPAGS
jgi:hypothetical protein